MRLVHRGCLVLSWVAIACLSYVTAADAASPEPTTSGHDHVAKGEVQFDNQWVPIDDLFKDYEAARIQLQGLNLQMDVMRGRLGELQHQLNEIKSQSAVQERPIRVELSKAKAKQREYQKVFDAKAPMPPQLTPMPPPPTQTFQLAQKYKQEMDAYRKAQDEAKKEMPKIQATITQDETQLKKIADDLETKQAPITDKFKTTSDEMGALLRQANTLAAKIQNMEAAMRAAPDDLRFAHGIVEWEGVFYPLADLEKLYTDTQAEINRVNQQIKAEADAAGRPLPANWRHPQQDRMDTLKALITRVKAVQAAK